MGKATAGGASTIGAATRPAACVNKTAGVTAARTAMTAKRNRPTPRVRCSDEPDYRELQNGAFRRKRNKK